MAPHFALDPQGQAWIWRCSGESDTYDVEKAHGRYVAAFLRIQDDLVFWPEPAEEGQ